jgi:C4-dicarboxylate-specific signal transduction histidine kinase
MSRVTTAGELTASIAHEVSQPLAAIAANANAAVRWLCGPIPNRDEARRALERVVADAERAGEVIIRVRRLVTRTPSLRDKVDLGEVIQETLALVNSDVQRNRIVLRTELASDLPAIVGDRVQLQQVILNLVLNGMEAMKGVEADGRELLVSAATDGKTITVSVRDSGVGVAPEDIDRIFDAFYTTKPDGLGMGLAVSRSIVEVHGGAVYAAQNFPRGMVFGFTLPLAAQD